MATRFHTPGSFWIELALWILFFPAGIIYSLWRWTSRRKIVTEPFGRNFVHYIYDGIPPAHANEGDLMYDMRFNPPVVTAMRGGRWVK